MTPTKTTPAKADALEQVAEAERRWSEARDTATETASAHSARLDRAKVLLEQRASFVHADPELVNHHGEAVSPTNPVGSIDAELSKLDVENAAAIASHSRELERAARVKFEDQVRNHGAALDESRLAEADAIRASWHEVADAVVVVADQWLRFEQRSLELAGIRSLDSRGLPIDAASAAVKTARRLADSTPDVR